MICAELKVWGEVDELHQFFGMDCEPVDDLYDDEGDVGEGEGAVIEAAGLFGNRRHPLLYSVVKIRVRAQLRLRGKHEEAADFYGKDADAMIDAALAEQGGPSALAFGDGSILKAIGDFLNSPAGQALIAALIRALIGAIG